MPTHKIVVVGAGFAGTTFINKLKGLDVSITLVDRRNHHLFQPLLYQVATALLSPADIAWPIRQLFRDRADVRTILGEVTGVDTVEKAVVLSDGDRLPYDTLVIVTGATHAYFGHDEWALIARGVNGGKCAGDAFAPVLNWGQNPESGGSVDRKPEKI